MRYSVLAVFVVAMNCFSQSVSQPYEVGRWQGFRTAAVSYTFDDLLSSHLTIAVPMFDEFGFQLTLFVVTSWVSDWEGLQNAASKGHEIASHTVSHLHLNELSFDFEQSELKDSQDTINVHITGQKCATFAYPYCYVARTYLVEQYYIAARVCTDRIEPKTPSDFMRIAGIVVGPRGPVKTSGDFKWKADAAALSKGWCVYLVHGIDDDGGYSPISSNVLRASLEYLKANPDIFWVAPFGNVVKYIRERNSAAVNEISNQGDKIVVHVTDTMDDSLYNVPLTVRRPLPDGWTGAKVVQNSNTITSQIVDVHSEKYIQFDVIPDHGDITISRASGIAETFTVITTGDSGEGSLFWAIEQANLHPGPDTVRFAIPETDSGFDGTAWWIRPKIALPVLSDDSTAILGGSQAESIRDTNPNGPEIVLDGTDMPENSTCLCINSSGNLVSGIVFVGSRSDGITVIGENARRNRIIGNYFGTDPTGTDARPNTFGVTLQLGARANRVGGSEPSEGNLISGCRNDGIYIFKSDSNVVVGNIIGLDRTGTQVLGNGSHGISIYSAGGNRVGGSLPGETNIISGNGYTGIEIGIDKNTRNNTVQGNFIGTDKSGELSLANESGGILVGNGASVNWIGGTKPGESNLISGNNGYGIYLFTSGTDSNRIEGNWIGTDVDGNAPLPNTSGGICIYSGPKYNQIGPSNTIRYNFDGICIQQYDSTLYNRITQNSISNNTRSGIIFFSGANGGIAPPSLFWNGSEATGNTVADGIVEIFSDSSSQGRIYEGAVTADGSGLFSWSGMPGGPFITATVTDPSGNTSEFSQPATVTAVDEKDRPYPQAFSLSQNFPNPFNPGTMIEYKLPTSSQVEICIFNLQGQKVATLVKDYQIAGYHQVTWNGKDEYGQTVASGVYLCQLKVDDFVEVKKMSLLR